MSAPTQFHPAAMHYASRRPREDGSEMPINDAAAASVAKPNLRATAPMTDGRRLYILPTDPEFSAKQVDVASYVFVPHKFGRNNNFQVVTFCLNCGLNPYTESVLKPCEYEKKGARPWEVASAETK